MPMFTYRCLDCGHEFPTMVLWRDYDDKKKFPCPECGCNTTVRAYKPVKIIYRGDDWTDAANETRLR